MSRCWCSVAVVSLVLLAAPAFAQQVEDMCPEDIEQWEALTATAREAMNSGDLVAAEKKLRLALEFANKPEGNSRLAASLNNLAVLYAAADRFAEATPLLARALQVWEETLGSDDPEVAKGASNLATLYLYQQQYADAEPLFRRALAIHQKQSGADDPRVARALVDLADLYVEQRKFTDAEDLFKRALAIIESRLGPGHPSVARTLEAYARLLRRIDRTSEAESMEARAKAIRNRQP